MTTTTENRLKSFLSAVSSEFPDDRLTFQKSIATFHADSAEEASRLFRLANNFNQQIYITGFGNNIDPIEEPFTSMLSVRTDRLNDLQEIASGDFFATVGSGYPLRELNQDLSQHSLFLPHSDLPYVGSVGGAIAVNLTATLGKHPLPIKKYLIKAEIVTPSGDIIRPGSVCFKSVSGYDIVKLFASSWGLLGLIVSATFRVLPVSIREEYVGLTQNGVDRERFLSGIAESNQSIDAQYSRKIKAKFDPNNILPIVL